MTATPEPFATNYLVTWLDRDHPEATIWAVRIEWRGDDRWAVCTGNTAVLGRNGMWHHEPLPSSRTDQWLADHRFSLEEAWSLAIAAADTLTVNGMTWKDLT